MTFKNEKRIPPVIRTVVADRSVARFFSATWPGADDWKEVLTLLYEEGAAHPRDVTTDGPGTFAERFGGHHAGEDETDFRHQSAERFASELVSVLETARSENEFGKLVLVAPPLFLGVLRKKIPTPLQQMLILELNKDYTAAKLDEVAKQVQAKLKSNQPRP